MRRVEENRHAISLQLSKEVESQTGVTISRDTIRRTLQRNGMHGCHPRKKPLLKQALIGLSIAVKNIHMPRVKKTIPSICSFVVCLFVARLR